MIAEFQDKMVLITGGTGSIGCELVRQILQYKPQSIRIFSRDEHKQFQLVDALRHHPALRLFVGDIRDVDRLDRAFEGVDIVLHTAALKHVPSCEYNPFEAIKTNIIGVQNVIDVAVRHNVDKVIAVSTDKALNPVSVMGATKLMMEKLIINANYYKGSKVRTRFACVRFGNVSWSRGSVLPLWKKQAAREKRITLTNPNMTRFFMGRSEAARLVLRATHITQGGEIFMLKMPAISMGDLAKMFLEKYFGNDHVAIDLIGERAGEKMHEELFNPHERYSQILEGDDMYILVPYIFIEDMTLPKQVYPREFHQVQGLENYSSKDFIDRDSILPIM